MRVLRAHISYRRQWSFWQGSGGHERSLQAALPELSARPVMTHDLAVLQDLYDAWIMDTESVALTHFRFRLDGRSPNRDAMYMARHRLRELWDLGAVLRGRPSARYGEGSLPLLYQLSRLGYEVLRQANWSGPGADPRLDRGYTPAAGNLDRILHHAEATQFMARWLARLDADGAAPVHWRPVGRATCEAGQGASRVRLLPDGIVEVGGPGDGCCYLVEWERSADTARFRDKLARLAAFRHLEGWRENALLAPPVYLVVAWEHPDPALDRTWGGRGRLGALVETARHHEGGDFTLFLRGEDLERGSYIAFTTGGEPVGLLWGEGEQ